MSQTDKYIAFMGRYANLVDELIATELQTNLDPTLQQALSYHFGWLDTEFKPVPGGGNSGKKLRPIMALLAYQGAMETRQPGSGMQTDLAPALPFAASLEMIHNYSLIHDDIEDDDHERRGRPTLWTIIGKPLAINAGSCLDMLAFRCLLRSLERGVDYRRVVALTEVITTTSIALTEGQNQDISFEKNAGSIARNVPDHDWGQNRRTNQLCSLRRCVDCP